MPLTSSTINTRIKNRTDTTANWTSVNPILAKGEIGFEDTGSEMKFKVGDGVSRWNSLDYVATPDEIQIGNIEPTKYKLWINPDEAVDDEIQISSTEPQKYKVWINPEGTNDGALTIYKDYVFRLDQNQQIVNFNNITYNAILDEYQRNTNIVAIIVGATSLSKIIFPLISHINSFIFGNVVDNAFYTIEINSDNSISFNQVPLGKSYTGADGIQVNNTTNVIRTDFGDSTLVSTSLFTLDFIDLSNSIMPSESWDFDGDSEELETEDENTYNYMFSELMILGHYFDPNSTTTTIKIYGDNDQIIHNISINELTLLEGLVDGKDVYLYDPTGFFSAMMLDDDSAFDLANWANVFGFAFLGSNKDGQDIDTYMFVASDIFLNNCIKLEMLQDKNSYKTIDSNAIKLSKNFIKKGDGTIDLAFGTLKKIQDVSDLKYYINNSASASNTLINNLYCFSIQNNSSSEGISAINSNQNFCFKNALDDKHTLHFFRFDEGNIEEYNINNLYPSSSVSSDYYKYLLVKYKNSYLNCKELPQGNPLYNIFKDFGMIDSNDNFIFFGCGYNTNTAYDTIINTSTIEPIDSEEQSFYFVIIFNRSNKTYCPLFLTANSTLDMNDFTIIHQQKLYHTLSFNALCQDGATRKSEDSFFAIGNNSIAEDEGAIAIGDSVETTGEYSVTFGQKNKNEGQKSIILYGTDNYISRSANYTLVGGYNNKINGSVSNSIILGRDNNISNWASSPIMLFGQQLQDSSSMYPCLTIGRYNASNSNALFIIGNGNSDSTRSNLLEIGNLYYDKTSCSAILNGAGLFVQGNLTIYGKAYYKENDTYYPYINTSLFQNLQPLSSSATLAEAITAYNNLLAILKGE